MKLNHIVAVITMVAVCLGVPKALQAQAPPARTTVQTFPVRTGFTVKIVGRKQGVFVGDARGFIAGIKFSQQFSSPRDAASGLPSGKRQYTPITFTKEWSPASPQIMQACAVNEELSTVTFEFVHTNPNGQEMVYQTIMLTNATVSSVRRYIGISTGSEPPDARPLEDVSLTFQKIEVQDSVGKTMFVDDWMAVR